MPRALAVRDLDRNAGLEGGTKVALRGHDLTLIEGQLFRENVRSWRTFLYDEATGIAELLRFRTPAGSVAFSNPTITQIEVYGRPAILVTLYVIAEGAAVSEEGELIYFRLIPDGTGS